MRDIFEIYFDNPRSSERLLIPVFPTNSSLHSSSLTYTPHNQVTNSREKSSSWEANSLSFPAFIIYCRNDKIQQPVPVSSQIYPLRVPNQLLEDISYSHLHLGLPSGSSPQVSSPKPCMHLSSPPYVLYHPPISFFLIWSPEKYMVRSTDRKVPRYAVFSTTYYLVPLRAKYPLQHSILGHHQLMFLPQFELPSFKPIQNNRQISCSVCLNVHIFG